MIKLLNSNRYELPGTNGRWIHLASLQDNFSLKEYICFIDRTTNKCYIEEIDFQGLHLIDDDNLINDLKQFLDENKILDMIQGYNIPIKYE